MQQIIVAFHDFVPSLCQHNHWANFQNCQNLLDLEDEFMSFSLAIVLIKELETGLPLPTLAALTHHLLAP